MIQIKNKHTYDYSTRITPIMYGGAFEVESLFGDPYIRSDISIFRKQGKYYYEFVVSSKDVRYEPMPNLLFANQGLGWCDDKFNWTYDGLRARKYDGRRARKYRTSNFLRRYRSYGVRWEIGDVVGCCIDVDKDGNTFDIGYYVNGKYLGIAFESCKYSGNLYVACNLPEKVYGVIILDGSLFKYMPDGYLPII